MRGFKDGRLKMEQGEPLTYKGYRVMVDMCVSSQIMTAGRGYGFDEEVVGMYDNRNEDSSYPMFLGVISGRCYENWKNGVGEEAEKPLNELINWNWRGDELTKVLDWIDDNPVKKEEAENISE